MTVYGSADVGFILLGGRDVRGTRVSLSDEIESVVEDTHALGDGWTEGTRVGIQRATLTSEGFYDDSVAGFNEAGALTTSQVVAWNYNGNVKARAFAAAAGHYAGKFTRTVSLGALHRANIEHAVSGEVDEGIILHEHATESSASGNTQAASVDNGASSANGGAGHLQVSALTLGGFTNFAPKIQHSVNNSTWVDLVTFATVTAAPNGQRITVAGTVNRYLSMLWAYTGAGSGQSATFMCGFARF